MSNRKSKFETSESFRDFIFDVNAESIVKNGQRGIPKIPRRKDEDILKLIRRYNASDPDSAEDFKNMSEKELIKKVRKLISNMKHRRINKIKKSGAKPSSSPVSNVVITTHPISSNSTSNVNANNHPISTTTTIPSISTSIVTTSHISTTNTQITQSIISSPTTTANTLSFSTNTVQSHVSIPSCIHSQVLTPHNPTIISNTVRPSSQQPTPQSQSPLLLLPSPYNTLYNNTIPYISPPIYTIPSLHTPINNPPPYNVSLSDDDPFDPLALYF